MKQRIELTDSTMSAMTKMADGNHGAANVLLTMLYEGSKIDPDNAFGCLGNILLLDSFCIYGTDIYILHNDICDRNMAKTLAVLRATQLGLFSRATLADACHRQDRSGKQLVPVDELYAKVKEQLPNFDNQPKEPEEIEE